MVDLKKRRMNFEKYGLRVITPLDIDEGQWYTEPIREEDHSICTGKHIQDNKPDNRITLIPQLMET
jgi:hypothetical protein